MEKMAHSLLVKKTVENYLLNFSLFISRYDLDANEVTIIADTIYMSQNMTIEFKLNLRARRIFIDKPLTMALSSKSFILPNTRIISYYGVKYSKNDLVLRRHKFGLVDTLNEMGEFPFHTI